MSSGKELERLIDHTKYEADSETFQKKLKEMKPFQNIKGNVSIDNLERFVFEISKRYMIKPQWITFSGTEEEKFYSVALVNKENHDHVGTIYGDSIYELFVKLALSMFHEIKKGTIKKVGKDE